MLNTRHDMPKVTKEWIVNYLDTRSPEDVNRLIGRALVSLLHRQTNVERSVHKTLKVNDIGFTRADAKFGSVAAKQYGRNKSLPFWQMVVWTMPDKNGVPRIAKYHKQLNEVANEQKQKQYKLNGM